MPAPMRWVCVCEIRSRGRHRHMPPAIQRTCLRTSSEWPSCCTRLKRSGRRYCRHCARMCCRQTPKISPSSMCRPRSKHGLFTARDGIEPRYARRYVFEGPKSGQGETVDWSVRHELRHGNMILAGGLGAKNVAEAISDRAAIRRRRVECRRIGARPERSDYDQRFHQCSESCGEQSMSTIVCDRRSETTSRRGHQGRDAAMRGPVRSVRRPLRTGNTGSGV